MKAPLTRQQEWRRKFPQRYRAHLHVERAKRQGIITPLPCEVCGARAEAHHPDYSKPLDVQWLCRKHHVQLHARAGSK